MLELLEKKSVMIGIVAVIVLMIGVIIYCLFFANVDKKITYDGYTILKGHYGRVEKYDPSHAIEGYKGDKKNAYYITGKITANKNKNFTIITFKLYDRKNKVLGTAVAGLNEVKKGKVYDFKAISLEKMDVNKVDHYKIKDIENMEVK